MTMLILDNINIYICCPSDPFSSDFIIVTFVTRLVFHSQLKGLHTQNDTPWTLSFLFWYLVGAQQLIMYLITKLSISLC